MYTAQPKGPNTIRIRQKQSSPSKINFNCQLRNAGAVSEEIGNTQKLFGNLRKQTREFRLDKSQVSLMYSAIYH